MDAMLSDSIGPKHPTALLARKGVVALGGGGGAKATGKAPPSYPATLPTDEKEGACVRRCYDRGGDNLRRIRMSLFPYTLPAPSTTAPNNPIHPTAFNEICDGLTREILAELASTYEMPEEALAWVKRMIEYNVKGGKLNRGLTVRYRCCRLWRAVSCGPSGEGRSMFLDR